METPYIDPKGKYFDLKNEIVMAEAINKNVIEPMMLEGLQRYTGTFFPKFAYNWDINLNEVYSIVQTNLPAIFYRNPRAYCRPRNKTYVCKVLNPETGRKEDVMMDSQKSANTQESILNYSLEQIKYKREVRKVLLDSLIFPHGVLWHGYKGDYGMTDENSFYIKDEMIFVKRTSPTMFLKDPHVNFSNIDEGRWVGRVIDIKYQDLVEDKKLDVNKRLIKGYKGFGNKINNGLATGGQDAYTLNNAQSTQQKALIEFTGSEYQNSQNCRFIRCYEIYLRPTKKEKSDGKKGKILLLTFEQPEPLRENDWGVKAEGFPASILQFNELNDSIVSLSDIDTYKSIADQKNIIVNLQLRNAQENSKVYVAVNKDSMDEEDVDKVRQGEQTVLLFNGDAAASQRLSVQSASGAASNELYIVDQRIQKNLDDKSGVNDLRRGVLQSGEESAISVKMRAASSSARPQYRQDLMSDFLKGSLTYLNQLLRQYLPYEDAVRIIGSLDLEWSDKPSEEQVQAEVDIEIDPISMLPENPEEELGRLHQILGLMLQGLTQPAVVEKIRQEGKTINLAPLIEQILFRSKVRNPEIFRNIRPDESMGYVSVEQMREAKSNVDAALTGQQIPYPPNPKDDHVAKLEVYMSIKGLLDKVQQQSDMLDQLIMIQGQLLQEIQEKEAKAETQIDLKKFKAQEVTV